MKTETVNLRLTPEEKEKLAAAAAARDISISQLIREAYREYLRKEVKQNAYTKLSKLENGIYQQGNAEAVKRK